jgi:hypothetical protein
LVGLAGFSLFTSTTVVTPEIVAAPILVACGEFKIRPPLLEPLRPVASFFILDLPVVRPRGLVASRLSSLCDRRNHVRSPSRATVLTIASMSVTLNSVQAFDAGVTFTSPAVAAIPFEVDTDTPAALDVYPRPFKLYERVGKNRYLIFRDGIRTSLQKIASESADGDEERVRAVNLGSAVGLKDGAAFGSEANDERETKAVARN